MFAAAEGTMRGKAVGVPPAHWSDPFSFGVVFSVPVRAIPDEAIDATARVVAVTVDNGKGTRWRFRIEPGWSADACIRIGAARPSGEAAVCGTGTVCGTGGQPLDAPVVVRVPARPTTATATVCGMSTQGRTAGPL